MCGGKGGQTGTSNQATQTSIPPEVLQRYNQVYARGEQAANQPFQSYTGQFVAPVNETQQAGIQNIANAGQTYQPYANSAVNTLNPALQGASAAFGNSRGAASPYNTGAAGLIGGSVDASSPLTSGQINQYMNPYTQNVVNATTGWLNQQNQQQQNALSSDAIMSGAFGGDRSGIAKGVLSGQQNLANASTIAGLYNQNYSQGLQAAQQQQGQRVGALQQGAQLTAGLGNQVFGQNIQAGQSMQNLGVAGAQAYSGLGQQAFNNQIGYGQALMGAGQVEQQTQQADLSARYNQFLQQQAYPFQSTQFLSNLATGQGALSGSTSQSYAYQPQPFFSDDDLKENVHDIGKTKDGLRIVRYNFKDDPKMRIGFLASDVESKMPEAVTRHNGVRAVDYERAARARGGVVPHTSERWPEFDPAQLREMNDEDTASRDVADPGMGVLNGLQEGRGIGDILSRTRGAGDPLLTILGGTLKGDDIGEIAGNAGKSLLGPGAGLVGLADGGRAGFAGGGGGGYDPMAFAQMLQAHQAMYPGAGGRPGVGGESGPRGMQLHQGKQPQLMKAEHPKMPAQPETGMKSAMNDVGDVAKAGKGIGDIYNTANDALYGKAAKGSEPASGGLIGHGGKGDYAAGWLGRNLGTSGGIAAPGASGTSGSITTQDNPAPAQTSQATPQDYTQSAGVAAPAPADSATEVAGLVPDYTDALTDAGSDLASSSSDLLGNFDMFSFARRGGRAARAPGGGIKGDIPYAPKDDGGYFPDDLDDPADTAKEMSEQKGLNNQNPQQKSGGSGGGGGAGDILGSVAKLAPLAMMFIKDGGRVGYEDGGGPDVELAEAPARGLLPVPYQKLREEKAAEREYVDPRAIREPERDYVDPRALPPEKEYVDPRRPPPVRTEGVVPAPGYNPERPGVREVWDKNFSPPSAPEEKPYVDPRRPPAPKEPEYVDPRRPPAPYKRDELDTDASGRYVDPMPPAEPPAAQAPGVAPPTPEPRAVGPSPGAAAAPTSDNYWPQMLTQESGNQQFYPPGHKKAGQVVTSPAGAIGIAQVMPKTGPEAAQLAGLPWNPELFHRASTGDPVKDKEATSYNEALGRAYYNEQLRTFKDPAVAAAAYNAGPGAVQQALAKAQATGGNYLSFLPAETQNYVAAVTGKGGQQLAYNPASSSPGAPGVAPASADPTAGLVPQKMPEKEGWLDRNEKYIVPALSFLGNMLASPSRTLAGSIGSGVVGAAQAYPTQQRIGQEQQRIGIAQNAQYIGIYNKLLEMANAQRVTNNGKVDPALQAQIMHYANLIGGGAGQSLPAPGAGGVLPATQSGEAAPALPTMPKPVGPTDKTPDSLRIPQPDTGHPDFQSKLGDQYNPTKINEAAKGITDVNVARGQQATAREIQQQIARDGFGTDKNGQPIYVPNWDQVTAYRDRVKTNPTTIAQMDQENSRRRAAGEAARKITEVVKEFEPNMFADFKADLSRFLTSGGANPNKAFAQMNADAYYTFLKEAAGIVSAGGMGHTTDQARDTLKAAFTDPQMPPGAVRNVLAQFLGSVDRDNDFYNDVQKNIARVPGMNIQMRNSEFDKDKPLQGYVEKRHKDTPVRGDLPEEFTEKNVGSTYMMTPHEMLNRFPKDATINGKPITIDWVRDNMFGGATGDKPMRFRIDKSGKPVRDNG